MSQGLTELLPDSASGFSSSDSTSADIRVFSVSVPGPALCFLYTREPRHEAILSSDRYSRLCGLCAVLSKGNPRINGSPATTKIKRRHRLNHK